MTVIQVAKLLSWITYGTAKNTQVID